MSRNWLSGNLGRKASNNRRLSLEPLEDRSLLSVTLGPITPPTGINLGGQPGSAPIVAGPGITAAAATHFTLSLRPNTLAGAAVPVVATALDANNHPAFGYSGTVNVSTTGSGDEFPAQVTFQDGYAMFRVSFATPNQSDTLTITDTKTSTLTGQVVVNVGAQAVASSYAIRLTSPNATGGIPPVIIGPQGPGSMFGRRPLRQARPSP